mgnify:CR=1 FL=1|tara:strand:+ start:622 stop:1518 length:897 start_codon:yes stop_codon:yes gene_type:complete
MPSTILPVKRIPSSNNSPFPQIKMSHDQLLFHQGDPADHIYLIQEGEIEIFLAETNIRIAKLGKGEAFGEQAILTGGVRGASARAINDATCLEISADNLRKALDQKAGYAEPAFEALLLQLALTNQMNSNLSRVSSGASTYKEILDMSNIQIGGDRKALQNILKSDKHGYSTSEFLFLKLVCNDLLGTTYISDINGLKRAFVEQGNALVITSGAIKVSYENNTFRIGAGGVIGLAEEIAGVPIRGKFEILKSINALVISGEEAYAGLRSMNKGLFGICRSVILRILKLKDAPKRLIIN